MKEIFLFLLLVIIKRATSTFSSNLIGYSAGDLFNIIANSSAYQVQQIIGSYGQVGLNSIQLQFSNGKSSYFSKTYGTVRDINFTFQVPAGQSISIISTCIGPKYFCNIQFTSNQGLQSANIGNPPYNQIGACICNQINMPGGFVGLTGFSGGLYNNLIGLKFFSNQPVVTSTINVTTLAYSAYSTISEVYGGSTGNFFFTNQNSSSFIQQVRIRSVSSLINAIQFQFSNGYLTQVYGDSSSGNGTASTFIVPAGQYITSIQAYFIDYSNINGIQFFTNLGSQSSFYGNAIGSFDIVNLPGGLVNVGGYYASSAVNGLYFASNPQKMQTTSSGNLKGMCFNFKSS